MAKRFTAIFFIVLGIVVFLTIAFFLVLMLAPGFSAFGLKYVAIGARKYDSGKVVITDEIGEFSGSVKIDVEEVPVYVYYTNTDYSISVKYHDDYSGFTKTNIDRPSLEISKGDDGSALIKAIGFKKFLFLNSNTTRYLSVYIPLTMVTGGASGTKSLSITSKSSDIEFHRITDGEEAQNPKMNVIDLTTSGTITYNTRVVANTFRLKTPNSIRIDSEYSTIVEATNYDLQSKSGRITAEIPIKGDFSAKTNLLDIRLISCRNLTIQSIHGNVKCYNKEDKINVSGTVSIQNKSGYCVLCRFLSEAVY